jgi:S-adenosylmethionine-dependent methyltransferase
MKLKAELGLHNLNRHLPAGSLRILDAGGGSGCDALPLARQGYRIDLVDYSAEMLRALREKEEYISRGGKHPADVAGLERVFPQPQFDAAVCHNALQFAGDARSLIHRLAGRLAPGEEILSLISGNRYTVPYRAAFHARDLDAALREIGARTHPHARFPTTITKYSADEIRGLLPAAGLTFVAQYGIRCLSDYRGDRETRSRPEVRAKPEKLEYAPTDKDPHNLPARWWQIIARRN